LLHLTELFSISAENVLLQKYYNYFGLGRGGILSTPKHLCRRAKIALSLVLIPEDNYCFDLLHSCLTYL